MRWFLVSSTSYESFRELDQVLQHFVDGGLADSCASLFPEFRGITALTDGSVEFSLIVDRSVRLEFTVTKEGPIRISIVSRSISDDLIPPVLSFERAPLQPVELTDLGAQIRDYRATPIETRDFAHSALYLALLDLEKK